jgi:hypothetical protein
MALLLIPLVSARSVSANEVQTGVADALHWALPGFEVSQYVRGSLIDGEPDEVGIVAVRGANSDRDWPSFSFVVLQELTSGVYKVVAFSCPDFFNPLGGHDIKIKGGSLFTHASMSGMETAESHRSQYRFDGRGLREIGSEYNRFYNGEDSEAAKREEVRRSWNLLTGELVEFSSAGVRKSKGEPPSPRYLQCNARP